MLSEQVSVESGGGGWCSPTSKMTTDRLIDADGQTERQTDNRAKDTIRNDTKEHEDKGSNNEH